MKKSKSILFGLAILLMVGSFAGLALRKQITLTIDGRSLETTVWAWRVADALKARGVEVVAGDWVTPPLEAWLPNHAEINVHRAFWVVIAAGGKTHSLWTTERVPANLLAQAGFPINAGDQIFLAGQPLAADQPLPQSTGTSMPYTLQVQQPAAITINDDETVQSFSSLALTLGQALWEAGIRLYNADTLEPALETPLLGQEIQASLGRSRPITIHIQGHALHTRTIQPQIGAALAEAGLALQGLDYSIPAETAPIPAGGEIQLVRVRQEISLETTPLPFGLEYQPLPTALLDTQQVVQVGEYGLTARQTRVLFEADPLSGEWREVSRQAEAEWVARPPKNRVIGYGTQIEIRTAQTPNGPIRYWRAVEAYASTYSPCHSGGDKCYPNTSSGKPVQKGVIAVTLDWYRAMQGLPVYVTNYGYATIEDVGGGLPDRHWVDLGYSDEDWVGWGGWVTVYFLAPPPANILWILE